MTKKEPERVAPFFHDGGDAAGQTSTGAPWAANYAAWGRTRTRSTAVPGKGTVRVRSSLTWLAGRPALKTWTAGGPLAGNGGVADDAAAFAVAAAEGRRASSGRPENGVPVTPGTVFAWEAPSGVVPRHPCTCRSSEVDSSVECMEPSRRR